MQFTRDEFTAAMRTAVEKRGADWSYPRPTPQSLQQGYYMLTAHGHAPTYFNQAGEGTCLIGAAMHELGMPLAYAQMTNQAVSVLGGRVPAAVALAARCAQIHQDSFKSWGESLAIYEAAVEIAEAQGLRANAFYAADLYYEARAKVTGERGPSQSAAMQALSKPMHVNMADVMKEMEATAKKVGAQVDALIAAANEVVEEKPVTVFPSVKIEKKDFSAGGYIPNPSVINLDEVYTWTGNSCFGGIWTEAIISPDKAPVSIFDGAKVLVSA